MFFLRVGNAEFIIFAFVSHKAQRSCDGVEGIRKVMLTLMPQAPGPPHDFLFSILLYKTSDQYLFHEKVHSPREKNSLMFHNLSAFRVSSKSHLVDIVVCCADVSSSS